MLGNPRVSTGNTGCSLGMVAYYGSANKVQLQIEVDGCVESSFGHSFLSTVILYSQQQHNSYTNTEPCFVHHLSSIPQTILIFCLDPNI